MVAGARPLAQTLPIILPTPPKEAFPPDLGTHELPGAQQLPLCRAEERKRVPLESGDAS